MKKSTLLLVAALGAVILLILNRKPVYQYVTEEGEIIVKKISDVLNNFLSNKEGREYTVYRDADKWAVGVGHQIQPGDGLYPYTDRTTVTDEEIDNFLAQDTAIAQNCVDNNVRVPLTENQRAALVSFAFNIGCAAFKNSSVLTYLNAGDYSNAVINMSLYNKSKNPSTGQLEVNKALVRRRADEQQLFMTA